MNNEYYGAPTTTSEDFLAHYGVKGMKWGVRRAIESGNAKRLGKHYARAAKKLKLLSMRTDKDLVSKVKKQHAKGIASRAIGGGLVSGIGSAAISKGSLKDRALWGAGIGGGMAAINLAGDAVDQIRLKRMLSSKGHAKNVAKRNAFEKEMRNSFKGTPYAKKINATKRDINNEINISKKAIEDWVSKSKKRRR